LTHIQHHNDADLHDENGEHITTCPATNGVLIANWERRIQYHLACHQEEEES